MLTMPEGRARPRCLWGSGAPEEVLGPQWGQEGGGGPAWAHLGVGRRVQVRTARWVLRGEGMVDRPWGPECGPAHCPFCALETWPKLKSRHGWSQDLCPFSCHPCPHHVPGETSPTSGYVAPGGGV